MKTTIYQDYTIKRFGSNCYTYESKEDNGTYFGNFEGLIIYLDYKDVELVEN